MGQGATTIAPSRGRGRTAEIVAAAQALTLERGYSGWTLDELADRVGVSRRTLFNHVESKQRAVLGPRLELDAHALSAFRDGRPTGQLLDDALHLVVTALDTRETAAGDWRRFREVLVHDDSLLQAVMAELDTVCVQLVEHATDRPGETEQRARLAFAVVAALLHVAADEAARASDTASVADHVRRLLPHLHDLLAERRDLQTT